MGRLLLVCVAILVSAGTTACAQPLVRQGARSAPETPGAVPAGTDSAADTSDDNGGLPDTTLPDDACGLLKPADLAILVPGTTSQTVPAEPRGAVHMESDIQMLGKEISCVWNLLDPQADVKLTVAEVPGHNLSETKDLADKVYRKLVEHFGPQGSPYVTQQSDVSGVGDRAVVLDGTYGASPYRAIIANQGDITVLIEAHPANASTTQAAAAVAATILSKVGPAASRNASTTTTHPTASTSATEPSVTGTLTVSGAPQAWLNTTWSWQPPNAVDGCSSVTLNNDEGDYGFVEVDQTGKVTFGSGRLPDALTGQAGKLSGAGTDHPTFDIDGTVSGPDGTQATVKGKLEIHCP